MFTFAQQCSIFSMPALFGSLSWRATLIAAIAVLFLWRVARRRPAVEGRRRRGFGFGKVVLVLLAATALYFVAIPHQVNVTFDGDGQHDRHGFRRVDKRDLWALRRATGDSDADDDETEVDAEKPDVDASNAEKPDDNVSRDATRAKQAVDAAKAAASADIARTLAEARSLAARAMADAKEIINRTSRDAAVLSRLTGKRTNAESSVVEAEVAEKPIASVNEAEAASAISSPTSVPAPSGAPVQQAAVIPAAIPELPAKPLLPKAASVAAEREITDRARTESPVKQQDASKPLYADRTTKAGSRSSRGASPAERPHWLVKGAGMDGDTYQEIVTVEHYKTRAECEEALQPKLQEATKAYVDRYLGKGASTLVLLPQPYIHEHLVKSEYEEVVDTDDPLLGEMTNLHVLLSFDRRERTHLQRMWRDAQTENRLLGVAGSAAGLLLVLGTVFSYLKLDTMTRGYYTRRLQILAAVVILPTVGFVISYWSNYLVNPRRVPVQVSPEAFERQIVPTPFVGGSQSKVWNAAARRNPT